MDKLKTILHKHQVHGKLRKELQALWMEDEHEKTVVGNLDDTESTTTNESEISADSITLPEGYKTLGELGQGGMGKVLRVQDLGLNRSVAMKLLHPQLSDSKISKLRFIEEAQFCAKLQHPNIVPVYRLGRLQEKQYYFTMKEIDGRSLGSVIQEVHQSLEDGKWRSSPSGWTFRRIIEVLHQVCNAMAYAHQHHVIHRDLKPENIMLGAYGEVLIIDWGIAKDLTTLPTQDPNGEFRDITGTPSYMAPEQARGEVHRLSPQSDIYSLGAILYEVLTGEPPFNASTPLTILQKVVAGPPPALEESETSWFGFESMEQGSQRMPPELKTICNKAMERDPHQRYGCAVEMAQALQDWLNGLQKRAQAMEMVERSQQLQDEIYELLQQSGRLHAAAEELLEHVPEWESDDKKLEAWDKQDEAKTLRETARLKELEREMLLHGALVHKSDLLEAHLELAAEYHKRHKEAEENSQNDRALHHETRLRVHLNHLPKQHRERYVSYIKGDGTLTIQTDNEESTFYLEPYQIQGRRLQCTTSRPIGKGSIQQLSIKMGSYRLRIITPEHQSIFYPLLITRKLNFDPASTRTNKKLVIRIPKEDELDDMECYIPAGPFLYGGDPKAINGSRKQRIWLDAFVMQKYPVTNRDYIQFLNDLVRQERMGEALAHVPRERGIQDSTGHILYSQDPSGRFSLREDADGDRWHLDWPVMMIPFAGAKAYADWFAKQTGKAWRLPNEHEWEKAARGADGRIYPWGNYFEPSWGCMRDSHARRMLPAPVQSYPVDCSPYGVRGMAGNMADWTVSSQNHLLETEVTEDTQLVYRGGSWSSTARDLRIVRKGYSSPNARRNYLGFRLMYPYDSH